MAKNLPANVEDIQDADSIPGLGRSPGEGNGNPFQCFCLENPHGERSLAGYGAWGRKELDMTKYSTVRVLGFSDGTSGKEPACQCGRHKRHWFDPWVGKIPWRRARQPTPVLLPEESCGQRSLVVCSPWGHTESDTTEAT